MKTWILLALPYIIPGAVAALGTWLIVLVRKNKKTAPLAAGIMVAEDAINAGVKALPEGPGAALKAAEAQVVAEKLTLVAAAHAEIDALAGVESPTTAVTDGGATVNLPEKI